MAMAINMNSRSVMKKALYIRHINAIRQISTSEKKKDGAAITKPSAVAKDIPDFTKPESQNWVSYGFSRENETDDVNGVHNIMFMGLTVCIVFGGFFYTYFPDFRNRDWAHREAFLELRRREAGGLPLVDKNYVEPANLILPTDEELGDREIII